MPKLLTWVRPKDASFFDPIFARHPQVEVVNALETRCDLREADGLLLTGGADITAEFLAQEISNGSILEKDADPERDRWEISATQVAVARNIPVLAICRGMQVLNVALGGTLYLHITGHDAPEQKDANVQELRYDRRTSCRFERVNSSHHQALDRLGEGMEVEGWCAADDVIEQVRLKQHVYAIGVQYHPERHSAYLPLFDEFFAHLKRTARS